MVTRRRFLKLAAMLSGAAGISEFIPEAIERAYAIDPPSGSSYLDAEHIVILMQENRSFDHALGTLQGVRGFNDPRAIRLGNGNSVFAQTDAAGNSYAPWRLDIRDTRITWMGSIPHSRDSQVDAWNYGQHNGWLEAKRSHLAEYRELPLTMGHYTREDLPFYYALADAFTVCDQHYCSAMTSTTPNRSIFWTGTVRDRQHAGSRVYMRNEQYTRGVAWKTFPERLAQAGISWKFYQNELTNSSGMNKEEHAWLANFGCNVLEDFTTYHVEAYRGSPAALRSRLKSLEKRIADVERKLSTAQDAGTTTHLQILLELEREQAKRLKLMCHDAGDAAYQKLSAAQRAQHDAAFSVNSEDPHYHKLAKLAFEDQGKRQVMLVPKGDILYQFRKDVSEGKLPTVSWLTAPEKFSDHPTSPWYGAWYVSEVMDVLTSNPEVWKKTIFILTYDENDGYFDHAPSFVAPDPKRPETGRTSRGIDATLEYTYADDELRQGVTKPYARSGPIGLGFRVPLIVASPWSRGGWVNSQLFDHTSTLHFLEHFLEQKFHKPVEEENISSWRRAICGDLRSAFRPFDPKQERLNFLDRDKFVVSIQKARNKEAPSNFRKLTPDQIADINRDLFASEFTSHQEPGIRPACGLPYELYADAAFTGSAQFALTLRAGQRIHGDRSIGAPFNVYARSGKSMRAATFTVGAGDELTEQIPLSFFEGKECSVDVHGPNGFYRSFSGGTTAPGLMFSVAYEMNGAMPSGNILVNLENVTREVVTVSIADNSYGSPSVIKSIAPQEKQSIPLDLQKSHGWYDFTLTIEGHPYTAHYAGHVETGQPSFTDPLMGRMTAAQRLPTAT